VPHGVARQAAIHRHYYEVLMPKERNDPQWDPDNGDHWTAFFIECRLAELAHYEGNGPPPPNRNAAVRKLWWGIEGRTLPAVLDHIATGNNPRLTMPQQHWLLRRMDAPASSSSWSSSSVPRTPRGGVGGVNGSPSSVPTRLLRPKMEPGIGASSTRVKKEPVSFTRVKKEHDALTPPSSKKARRLADEAAGQLDYQALDNPEEFPGLRAAEVESFNDVQSGTLKFALAWSRQDAKRAEAERARRLSLCVNLDDDEEDDAGPKWRRGGGGNGGQGCSTWAPKDEPSDDDDDDGGDYSVFYHRLGMN
jgi:hypothetical protein